MDKGGVEGVEPKKVSDSLDTSTIAASEEELLFISELGCVNLAIDKSTQIDDSCVSFHLTPKRECFSSYTTGDYEDVKMGNDGARKFVGIGNVLMLTSMGCKILLKDVHHVPDIWLNLISANRLDDEGYCSSFQNDIWKFARET